MVGYGEDLAYIRDASHSDYALGAAPGLLRLLRRHGVGEGLVVDLGCGSGRWARELELAGYSVLGVDRSSAMIRMAKRNAPRSRFRAESLWTAKLPPCDAITSIGECLNYSFDGDHDPVELFRRAHAAMRPGGLLVFDAAGPGRLGRGRPRLYWSQGPDWAVMSRTTAGDRPDTLVREIVVFRGAGRHYRRSREVHRLRLFRPGDLADQVKAAGFRVRRLRGYGEFRFPRGLRASRETSRPSTIPAFSRLTSVTSY